MKKCDICQTVEHETTHLAGLLHPLPIPQQMWMDISIDFIEELPKSQAYHTLLVVVDRLSKFGNFVPLSRPYTTFTVVELFMKHIFKLHGLPKFIVSNKDPVFFSSF